MRKYILLIMLFFFMFLISCYRLDNIEQYVGNYKIYTNYKRTYHYSYGSSKLKNEANLISRSFTLEIKDDGSVVVKYDNEEEVTGKVSTSSDSIKFHNIPYLSDYKFAYTEKSEGIILDYSKTETKIGFEYDYISERFALIKIE